MDLGKREMAGATGFSRRMLFKLFLMFIGLVLLPAGRASAERHLLVDGNGNASLVMREGQEQAIRSERVKRFRPGELLVKFKPGVAETTRLAKHRRMNAEVVRNHRGLRLHQLRLKKGMTVEEAIDRYRSDPDVEYAEPNYLVYAQNTPNDPQFTQQWALATIKAPTAWDLTTGTPTAVVAILDTGIDYTHNDLAGNIWVNQSEQNGLSGIDDDGNGYIDDIYGYNAVKNSGDPRDDHYHGTHVAGIIGAVGNNATGVAGVAWNVRLMACKFIEPSGTGTIGDAIECLQYLKAMKNRGVNIVASNNSWGTPAYSQALYDAILDQKEILFIASAGNDNSSNPSYPAGYDLPNIISVASSDIIDQKSSFSNYDKWGVDIAAPGSNILSTFPGSYYTTLSGTSMSAPHVSGLAVLLNSQDPNRTAAAMKNLILTGGDTLSSFAGLTVTGSRINAFRSLTCSNRPLFAILHAPQSPQPGLPQSISAMSVNCDLAVGPVSVTLSGGETIQLLDDGVFPDLVADDGIFTGTWTPTGTAVEALTFTSPLGVAAVSSPPVKIGEPPTILETAMLLPNSVTSANINTPFSQIFPYSGGIPPFTWSLAKGSLPAGLTLNSASGEISGAATKAGIFPITLQVSDSLGVKDRIDWSLMMNDGLRPGWPRELQQRTGTGFLPESYSPTIADLDGDGKDEIIVGDVNTLYLFNPDGTSGKTVLPGKVTTPVTADLDGDGRQEIIVSVREYYTSRNSIYAFHHDLTPVAGFPAGAYSTVNGGPGFVSSPVAADFNDDGRIEVVVVASPNNIYDPNYDKNVVVMVDSQGVMVPGWPQIFGLVNDADSPPAIGDIDRDGEKELLFATTDGFIRAYRPNGVQLAQWQFDQPALAAWSPVLADMNGDGILEIVVKYHSAASQNVITVMDASGNILPGWPKVMSGNGSGTPYGPIVADIDSDGVPEIITVTGGSWNELHALRGDGSSLSGWPVIIPSSSLGRPIFNCYPVVADVDYDGNKELLITTVNYSSNGMLLGYSATGTLLPGFPKYASMASEIRSTAAVGDVDGNGRFDMVVKSENGFLFVYEMPQNGSVKELQWPMFRKDAQHTGTLLPYQLTVNPETYDFQEIMIGSSSTPQSFTITNPASIGMTISSVSIAGPDSEMFSVSQGSCGDFPFTLGPLQECAVDVVFTPTSVGVKGAALTLTTSTQGMAPRPASLAGAGVVPYYTLSYIKSGSGNGMVTSSTGTSYSGSGSETVQMGTAVTLTPAPTIDSLFSGWSGCDSVSGEVCTVVVSSDRSVIAEFALKTFVISATAGANGTISGPETVYYGQSASYTITPAAGYRVDDVVVDGISVGAVSSYSFTDVTASHTIGATFAELADLSVNSVAAPSKAARGKKMTASASVVNRGGTDAGPFTVAFYLSHDSVIDGNDTLLGNTTVSYLNSGGDISVSGSFVVPRTIAAGEYYVGVIVDSGSVITESDESNNSMAAGNPTAVR